MFKEEFKSSPGSYSVCANRDQLEKTNLKININGALIPVLEKYDWWEKIMAIPDESKMRSDMRKNRVIAFMDSREEAIELYNLLRRNAMVALRNWLD